MTKNEKEELWDKVKNQHYSLLDRISRFMNIPYSLLTTIGKIAAAVCNPFNRYAWYEAARHIEYFAGHTLSIINPGRGRYLIEKANFNLGCYNYIEKEQKRAESK